MWIWLLIITPSGNEARVVLVSFVQEKMATAASAPCTQSTSQLFPMRKLVDMTMPRSLPIPNFQENECGYYAGQGICFTYWELPIVLGERSLLWLVTKATGVPRHNAKLCSCEDLELLDLIRSRFHNFLTEGHLCHGGIFLVKKYGGFSSHGCDE